MRAENRTLGENGREESGESRGRVGRESGRVREESGKSRGESGGESGAGYLTLMCKRKPRQESRARVGESRGSVGGESGTVGQSRGRVGGEPLRIGGAAAARTDDLNVSVLLAGSLRQSHSRQRRPGKPA